jgi:hypothetical protein
MSGARYDCFKHTNVTKVHIFAHTFNTNIYFVAQRFPKMCEPSGDNIANLVIAKFAFKQTVKADHRNRARLERIPEYNEAWNKWRKIQAIREKGWDDPLFTKNRRRTHAPPQIELKGISKFDPLEVLELELRSGNVWCLQISGWNKGA